MANTWGESATTWGQNAWGQQSDVNLTLTSLLATSSLGSLAYAGSTEGWGRDAWGDNEWGTNIHTVPLTTSLEMTAGFGPGGWGISPWEEQVSWGGDLALTTTQLSIAALTGIEMTGSVGTPTYAFDMINFAFSGPSQIGAGLGVPNINDGADHTQGMGSLLATGSVGTLDHEMKYEISGLEATGALNASGVEVSDAQIMVISVSLLATGSVGSTTTDDMAIGLSSLQATGSVGAITPADMVVGLTGLSSTASVNSVPVSVLGYKDIDITGNTSYTYVTHAG